MNQPGALQFERAPAAGLRRARELQRDGLIHAALLVCQDRAASVEAGDGAALFAAAAEPEVGSVFA